MVCEAGHKTKGGEMSEKIFTAIYDEHYKMYKLWKDVFLAGFVWFDEDDKAWLFQQDDDFGGFSIQELQEILEFMRGLEW